jgi:hypothetical protein
MFEVSQVKPHPNNTPPTDFNHRLPFDEWLANKVMMPTKRGFRLRPAAFSTTSASSFMQVRQVRRVSANRIHLST